MSGNILAPQQFGAPTPGILNMSAVGTSPASATPIYAKYSIFTNVVPGAYAQLPQANAASVELVVLNRSANPLNIIPDPGGQIESNGTNLPISLGTNSSLTFTCVDPNAQRSQGRQWWIKDMSGQVSTGPVLSVLLFGAVGDGITDDTAAINDAITAAVGVILVFPATSAFYLISSPLLIPSNTHLIVDAGARIQIGNGANCSGIEIAPNASNILIELYGTLDGNVVNQPTGAGASGGIIGQGNVPCSNVYITGGKSGVITNWKNWPISLTIASDCEVNGLTMSNCGNSAEFAGVTPKTTVSSGTYSNGSGTTSLTTAAPHGILTGQTFVFFGTTNSLGYSGLLGEYVATAGTTGTTLNFTAQAGLGSFASIPPAGSTGFVGITAKCFNVGFVECKAQDIQDLGLVFYGGVVGGYSRGCEVTGCSGPVIFNDVGQPGSNWDCVIEDYNSHDNNGSGPSITSNWAGGLNHRCRIVNGISKNNLGGGLIVGAADGAEVFGNLLHNNTPINSSVPPLGGLCGNLLIGNGTNANVWGNTISDPAPAYVSRTNGHVIALGSSYDTTTGNVVLITAGAHNTPVGGTVYVGPLRGTGAVASLKGFWVATAGTAGTTLTYTAAAGLGTVTIFDGFTTYEAPFPANNTIASGTYDSPTGNVVLTTTVAHGYVAGNMFLLSNVTGAGGADIDGLQIATAGSTGSTLNFTTAAGGTVAITGGNIYPPNVGIAVFPDSSRFPNSQNNTRITNNFIGDTQSTTVLGAAIGGIWGINGYSGGNIYGKRLSVTADVSQYTPGINVQGPSQDTMFQVAVGNYSVQGYTTFQGFGLSGLQPAVLPVQGLTPSWNLSSGAGEVDFYCGRGAGGPGGFNFVQVAPVTVGSGTYNSGTGAVAMTTRVPHGMLPGSIFTVSGVTGTGADIALLNGVQTATAGTTGSTLDFTDSTGLTISSITSAIIVPAATEGGVIDTTVGVAGSILANDGLGNTGLGGALVHRAAQIAALVNGGTVTVNANTSFVLVQNAASIATASLVLPAPKAGQFAGGFNELEINVQNPIGALTVTAATGASVINAPTAIAAAGNSISFINVGTVWTRRIMV